MTVRQLLANLDSAELSEWMAFNQIEPFGEARADLRAGIIASTVAGGAPIDYMPFQKRRQEETGPLLLADPDAQSELILGAFRNVPIIRHKVT
ncbi:phage tail assembly protein T [Paraburkholderia terrae]|uniref:phage tail assembly protein T n=1 Tax=Paraburkholderia terrae TaxID=311230 RepID=UPI00296AB1B3|nr:hypothetical protein [Paraburkholderia terrae]MDW3655143.1 hypothetical protein [Paraburkholderia terrae]